MGRWWGKSAPRGVGSMEHRRDTGAVEARMAPMAQGHGQRARSPWAGQLGAQMGHGGCGAVWPPVWLRRAVFGAHVGRTWGAPPVPPAASPRRARHLPEPTSGGHRPKGARPPSAAAARNKRRRAPAAAPESSPEAAALGPKPGRRSTMYCFSYFIHTLQIYTQTDIQIGRYTWKTCTDMYVYK